jgi:hypothetical protein
MSGHRIQRTLGEHMKRRAVFAVVVSIVLALAAPTTAGAALGQYDRPEAGLDVVANRWNPGSQIELVGSNYSPGEGVSVDIAGETLDVEATTGGTFSAVTEVPDVAPGLYNFVATGDDSQRRGEFAFYVQPFNPWGEPSSYWFPVGTDLKFSGHRFANTEVVDVVLDGNIVSSLTTDVDGEFANEGSYVVPRQKFGQQLNFTMIGRTSGATASFTAGVANWPLLPEEEPGEGEEPGDGEEPGEGDPDDGRPDPVTPVEPTIETTTLGQSLPGQSLWHVLDFEGGNYDVCDLRVTASGNGVDAVAYPFNRPYSSPYNQTGLDAQESDFVAIKLTAASGISGNQDVQIEAIYRSCDSELSVDQQLSKTVTLPVVDDVPFRQITTDLGTIDGNSPLWADVFWQGQDGNLTDFEVRVSNPRGAGIRYPSERDFTSLQGDSTLDFGEVDRTAINIDPTGLASGTYVIDLVATAGPHRLERSLSFNLS